MCDLCYKHSLNGEWLAAASLLYEINTRVWVRELSARAGKRLTLDTVPPEEIERIAASDSTPSG